jgi:hypothetical protein
MIDEIRSYHYDPEQFSAYREWALSEAVPFLKANLDLVGFWLHSGEPAEFNGRSPMDLPLGSANVTWIIRWKNMQDRTEGHARVFQSEGWQDIWSRHPDAAGYLQTEARFAESV